MEHVRIVLPERDVDAVVRLLEDEAPLTCAAVLANLPLEDDLFHAKWGGKEVYSLFPLFDDEPGVENGTITPIPGDVCYIHMHTEYMGYSPEMREAHPDGLSEIAVFYGRNSFLFGHEGAMPVNVFGTIVENLDEFADTCTTIFREGFAGETMRIERAPDYGEDS